MVFGYLQVPVWHLAEITRHAHATERLNAAAQMSPCAAHYYDISHFFIHDLTYKARTLPAQTRKPEDHPTCQA